jgi:hypothetical protein
LRIQFFNVRPLASSWESEIPELTEAVLNDQVKEYLPRRPLEFDLERGAIYSRCEQVGSFRVIPEVERFPEIPMPTPSNNVIPFQRRC